MLPEKLSNGLCSLNPEVERLCMVCDMLVTRHRRDPRLPVLSGRDVEPRPLHLHRGRGDPGQHARARGACAARTACRDLLNLHDVYRALLKARNAARRGGLRDHRNADHLRRERPHRADRAAHAQRRAPADRGGDAGRQRLHAPTSSSRASTRACSACTKARRPRRRTSCATTSRPWACGMTISDDPTPAEFQKIAEATKERPDAQQIHTMLLRSMQQAIYTPINSGHFGLAYDAYTHFTSPIRRYPDLLVHRVIKAILAKRALPAAGAADAGRGAREAGAPAGQPRRRRRRSKLKKPPPPPSREVQAWEAAGLHCSANERRADEASRDVEAWLKCKYMREHLGEEYGGVVTRGHQLRHLRHARRDVRRGPGAHHRAGRRVLQVRRGAAGTARRAHRHPLCHRHAGAGAGQPRRPGRPQDRLPPGARRRGTGGRAP